MSTRSCSRLRVMSSWHGGSWSVRPSVASTCWKYDDVSATPPTTCACAARGSMRSAVCAWSAQRQCQRGRMVCTLPASSVTMPRLSMSSKTRSSCDLMDPDTPASASAIAVCFLLLWSTGSSIGTRCWQLRTTSYNPSTRYAFERKFFRCRSAPHSCSAHFKHSDRRDDKEKQQQHPEPAGHLCILCHVIAQLGSAV
jgi:hypothetical protein